MAFVASTAIALGLGVAGIGGAVIASGNSKSAANTATQAAQQSAAQNNALQSQIYGQNSSNLSPYMQRGNAAGDSINSLLGLNSTPSPGFGNGGYFGGQQGGGQSPGAAGNAFQNYLGSDGYQFRRQQGLDATNAGYAARGMLQSGAALKALSDYGQNTASSEFGKYLGYLGGQQGVGLSGANALAGVGTNYANATSANNDSAASARGNAALASSGQQNGTINSLFGAAGNIGGQYANSLGSSYGSGITNNPGFQNQSYTPAANGTNYTAADYGF
jgi:hypothetical protein